jgi:hypothetical protein
MRGPNGGASETVLVTVSSVTSYVLGNGIVSGPAGTTNR